MLNAGRLTGSAMEMLKSGEGCDCVIEVESNDGHEQRKVYFFIMNRVKFDHRLWRD
jgi:hypothetical protein